MEGTLEYICGNNVRLVEEFIAVMANLARSFFTANAQNTDGEESENDAVDTNIHESDAESSEARSGDICASVVDSAGTPQQGEHREAVRTAGESDKSRLGFGQSAYNRRGLRNNGFWSRTATWICSACGKRFIGGDRGSIRSGNIQTGTFVSRPDEAT